MPNGDAYGAQVLRVGVLRLFVRVVGVKRSQRHSNLRSSVDITNP